MSFRVFIPILCLTSAACGNDAAEKLADCRKELNAQIAVCATPCVPPAAEAAAGSAAAATSTEAPAPVDDDVSAPVEEPAEAPTELKPGATYRFTSGNQTVVMNPNPVDDRVWRFQKGDTCRYGPGAKIQVVGKRTFKEEGYEWVEYLVRYKRDGDIQYMPERLAPRVPEVR